MSLLPNGLLGEVEADLKPQTTSLLGLPSLLVDVPQSEEPARQRTWLSGRDFDGRAVYLSRRRTRATLPSLEATRASTLLAVPIHRLLDNAARAAAAKSAATAVVTAESHSATPVEDQLWVDRYRPSRFTDLLGDERVHRETMAWLKEWDFCVFGTNRRRKRQREETDIPNLDELQRPRERILLLSGPPGLGKTTLAHVVAKQAGYNVLEINASDARTGQVVDDRIRPALEAGSAIGSSRPVLVVIDEIDGATGGGGENSTQFVNKLLGLLNEKPAKKGRGQKQAPRQLLRRPIICICNDLYAASLARLRPHTRIIRFQKAADIHLVRRLRDICEREGLRPDGASLSTLVGVAQGDMRGCINTLQFIKAKGHVLTEDAVRQATTGMKEAETSFMSILTDLFTPLSKRRVKELGLTEKEESRYVARLSRGVESSGTIDKVMLGCFEHYITLRQQDSNFDRFEKAISWLGTYDVFNSMMRTDREYGVLGYLAYPAVAFYPLFQERGGSKIERPKADWENYLKVKQSEEIYQSLARCLVGESASKPTEYRHMLSNGILQLEFAPLINRIISPPLRPINSQVIKPDEKRLLSRLVEIMVALDLRFLQEKTEDGNLVYRLDPPVDVFITYEGKRAPDVAVSRYAVRHLVAGEIDERAIQRSARVTEFGSQRRLGQEHDDEAEDIIDQAADSGRLIAGRQPKTSDITELKVAVDEKGPVDFFGRAIAPKATAPTSRKGKEASIVPKVSRVTYRFNEGNSAAVRRPVKVSSLL